MKIKLKGVKMLVIGYCTDSWQKDVPGTDRDGNSKVFVNKGFKIEGLQLRLAPTMALPESNRKVEASVTVVWHKATEDAKAWVSFECNGWGYRNEV